MPGVLVGIVKRNLFVMVPIGLKMRLLLLNSFVKKARKPICAPARKRVIRLIAMGRIKTRKRVVI